MKKVRYTTQVPTLNEFIDTDGTPFVIDEQTGNVYLKTLGNDIVSINSGSSANVMLNWYETSPLARTVTLVEYAPAPFSINFVKHELASGSIDFTLKINGTAVGGLSNIGVSATPTTTNPTSGFAVSTGDKLTMTLSNNSSPVGLSLTVVALSGSSGHVTIPLYQEVGTAQTVTLVGYAAEGFTIDKAVHKTESGTISANFKINGTSITGLSAVSVGSTQTTTNATGANTVSPGDKVSVTLSSPSTCVGLSLCLIGSKS